MKLKVEVTIRIDDSGFNVDDVRDIIREYLKRGDYTFNKVGMNMEYRAEGK